MPNGFPGQSGFAEAQKFYGARSQQLASRGDIQWIVMVLVFALLAVAGGIWYFHEPRPNDEGPLWKPFGSRLWKSETPIQYFCFETVDSVEARKGKPWRRRYYSWVIMNSTSEKLQVEVQFKDSAGGTHRDQLTLYAGTLDYDAPMAYADVKGKMKVSVLGGPVLTQRPKNVKTRQFAVEKLKTIVRDLKNAFRD